MRAKVAEPPSPVREEDLRHWNLLRRFRQCLEKVFGSCCLGRSWEDPKRVLGAVDYLSLFLFGLLNPVARTLRGLSEASILERVQQEVCSQRVPRATFSEAQHVLEPALLEKVFDDLSAQVPKVTNPQLGAWEWLARDGSLFRALPRMTWALYGAGSPGAPNRAVRLHLCLHVFEDKPVRAAVRAGRVCERAVWEEQLEAGAAYIADRYIGENYKLFYKLARKGCAFVVRLLDNAVINIEEELPVSQAEAAAGVVRQAWAHLGGQARYRSIRLRLVWIQHGQTALLLATNLGPDALGADLIDQLYRHRWRIELFFRWVKCVLSCGHWIAESAQGATIQIYLALIAALLFQLYTGRRPTKRMMELMQFYHMGWATEAELEKGLERYRQEMSRRKS